MTVYHLIYSLINLIIALFFVVLGIFAVIVPWSGAIQSSLIQFILEDALAISLFGFAFLVIGLYLLASIILNARKRTYRLKSDGGLIDIEESVIQDYVNAYCQKLFPDHEIPCRLQIKDNKIHLSIDFPNIPEAEQINLLKKVKSDFKSTFARILGYREQFFLNATFQPQRAQS